MSRSPYGERGLKFRPGYAVPRHLTSLSLRRAWIEIGMSSESSTASASLSLRRAWIEINDTLIAHQSEDVALLTESVD